MNILKMLFGTKNERDLKRIAPIVEQIKKIEEDYESRHLTAEGLRLAGWKGWAVALPPFLEEFQELETCPTEVAIEPLLLWLTL